MSNDHTPTEEQMRYKASLVCHQGGCNIEDPDRAAAFDRFIARVKAEAWEQGMRGGDQYHREMAMWEIQHLDIEPESPANPYREGEAR